MENDKSVLSTLILIRDRISAMDWINERYGICQVANHCYSLELISHEDFHFISCYLIDNLPARLFNLFCWPLDDQFSRLNWLDEHIKKLSADQSDANKREFLPYELAAMEKVPLSIFKDTEIAFKTVMDDVIRGRMTIELTATIYADTIEERDLEYIFERPTFLDWLFRRERKATFKFKAQDILLNPPKTEGTIRTYTIN